MSHIESKTLRRVVREYAHAVASHGWSSSQAKMVREENASDSEFMAYADAYDSLKHRLTGIKKPDFKAG